MSGAHPGRLEPWDAHNQRLVGQVHPADWRHPPPAERYNLVVIGAGPAGLVAAAAAARRRALEGTQPVFRQSPPISPPSISTTRAPICTAPAATDNPPEPAPITQISVSITPISQAPLRKRFRTIGSADRAASPRIGPSTCGAKMMPRSGVLPAAKTSPKPAPTEV